MAQLGVDSGDKKKVIFNPLDERPKKSRLNFTDSHNGIDISPDVDLVPKKLKLDNNHHFDDCANGSLFGHDPEMIPDFLLLAEKYPSFKPFVQYGSSPYFSQDANVDHGDDGNSSSKKKLLHPYINWKDAAAVLELNRILLLEWFNVRIELPPDRLCPTILSRTHYCCWIYELLKKYNPNPSQPMVGPMILGLDIGTGASCIYPLIGRAMYQWKFIATDIDTYSLKLAHHNVCLNKWDQDILVVQAGVAADGTCSNRDQDADEIISTGKASSASSIFFNVVVNIQSKAILNRNTDTGEFLALLLQQPITFSMCNPPFFSSVDEKVPRYDTTCTASDSELCTQGGEVQFIKQMIDESLIMKDRIIWYTTLIGKKATLSPILDYLRIHHVLAIERGQVKQGRNRRWIVAWTFHEKTIETIREQRKKSYIMSKAYNDTFYSIHLPSGDQAQWKFDTIVEFISDWFASQKITQRIDLMQLACFCTLYSTSPWYLAHLSTGNMLEDSSKSEDYSTKTIGPEDRPEIVLQCECKVTKMDKTHFILLCTLKHDIPSRSSIITNKVNTKNIFGILVRKLEAHLVQILDIHLTVK